MQSYNGAVITRYLLFLTVPSPIHHTCILCLGRTACHLAVVVLPVVVYILEIVYVYSLSFFDVVC